MASTSLTDNFTMARSTWLGVAENEKVYDVLQIFGDLEELSKLGKTENLPPLKEVPSTLQDSGETVRFGSKPQLGLWTKIQDLWNSGDNNVVVSLLLLIVLLLLLLVALLTLVLVYRCLRMRGRKGKKQSSKSSLISKDTISKDMFSKDMFNKDTISKDMFSKDMIGKETISKDMFRKDMIGKEMISKEVDLLVRAGKDFTKIGDKVIKIKSNFEEGESSWGSLTWSSRSLGKFGGTVGRSRSWESWSLDSEEQREILPLGGHACVV